VIVFDDWHLGSRGWYYLRSEGDAFIPLRSEAARGHIRGACEQAMRDKPASVVFVHSVRDSSPDGQVEQAARVLADLCGPPLRQVAFVNDSAATLRLKQWLRRGSGVETHEGKIAVLVFKTR
jgi:hypothetical protein